MFNSWYLILSRLGRDLFDVVSVARPLGKLNSEIITTTTHSPLLILSIQMSQERSILCYTYMYLTTLSLWLLLQTISRPLGSVRPIELTSHSLCHVYLRTY